MSIWCIDYVNGSSLNSGSLLAGDGSFAIKASGSTGVANGTTTFTDAGATFTVALIGHYINIQTKGKFKINAVPNGTALTLASTVVTGSGLSYVIGGALDSINTLTSSYGLAAGDSVRVAKTADPLRVQTSAGVNVNGSFTNKSKTVTLSAAATADLNQATGAGTAGANVTASTSATRKLGSTAAQFVTNGSFTTAALIGYFTTSQADYSAYQKVSFWIFSTGSVSSGTLTINCYTGADGATGLVHSFTLNQALAANDWMPVIFDNGGALSNNINSIAIYSTGTFATKTVLINNILACNRLTLTSMVSKDSAARGVTDGYHPVQSISGTTLLVDSSPNTLANASIRGYSGTTETVAIFSRESLRIASQQSSQLNGSSGNTISYTGGWDSTSNTQPSETWMDIGDSHTNCLSVTHAFNSYVDFTFIRAQFGLNASSATSLVFNGGVIACSNNGLNYGSSTNTVTTIAQATDCAAEGAFFNANCTSPNITTNVICGNQSAGIEIDAHGAIVNIPKSNNNGNYGVYIQGWGGSGTIGIFNDNQSYGVVFFNACDWFLNCDVTATSNGTSGMDVALSSSIYIRSFTSTTNGTSGITLGQGQVTLGSGLLNEATKVTFGNSFDKSFVAIQKYNGVATDARIYKGLGTILTDTSTRHTASGVSWNLQPNANATATYPLTLDSQAFAVDTTATTRSVYTRKDNAAIVNSLVTPGGIIPGVPSDVSTSSVAAINTWDQISVTWTASDQGGIIDRYTAHAAGVGGNNAWFDD